jgi:hypothetical protein
VSTPTKPLLSSLAGLALVGLCVCSTRFADSSQRKSSTLSRSSLGEEPQNLHQLLGSPLSQISQLDIALMNLLCAAGLPGAENLATQECMATLDRWTERVRSETERHRYRFKANPREFDSSEGYFRMLMMAVVLYEDFSVRYNPARITTPANVAGNDHFFADSRDLFLHGLLGAGVLSPKSKVRGPNSPSPAAIAPLNSFNSFNASTTPCLGTCSSMPVLYVALGRRLGYPVKLATTKSHLFIRWDSPTERFNLEATGKGMNRYDDEHFKRWPFPVTEEEIRADGYLKSLSPVEELALFLSLRGHCLNEAGRLPEAIASYAEAVRLAPDSRPYRLLLADARQRASQPGRSAGVAPASSAGVPPVVAPPPDYAQTAPLLPPPPPPLTVQPGAPPDPNPLLRIRQQ